MPVCPLPRGEPKSVDEKASTREIALSPPNHEVRVIGILDDQLFHDVFRQVDPVEGSRVENVLGSGVEGFIDEHE